MLMPLPLTLFGLLLGSTLAAQEPATNSSVAASGKDDCAVSGVVLKQSSNEPLKSARVQLRSADEAEFSTTVVTDAGGTFQFKGIKSGRYYLWVSRIGFVPQSYGQRTPTQPGAIVTLTPGQNMHDLLFHLLPTGVISGRIQNEEGEPLPRAEVTVHREVYSNGKLTLNAQESVTTNDHGEYRLFDLQPGRYLVSASHHPGNTYVVNRGSMFQDFDGEKSYVPIFYPGSANSTKAEKITVRAGEEIPSIDFILQEVAAYRVQGRVVYAGVAPTAPKKRQNAMVELMPRDTGNNLVDHSIGSRNFLKADGTFELLGVLPGAYVLTAQMFNENERHFAVQNIDVGNANVEGLQIIITPGIPISGHVHWDGIPGSQNQDVNLVLSNLESERIYGGYASVLSDGSFNFREVNDGTYRVIAFGLSPDFYLANVSYAGIDSADGEIKVRHSADASLKITFSSRGARVQGAVSDSDGLPSAGVWVVLVPDTTHRNAPWLYRSTHTDQHGQFAFRGIKPGDYKLFSWEEVEDGAWQDPDFLKSFEDKGQSITLQIGDTKSINVVALKTASAEGQRP
jgi:protocatechuate 3,4-dioxygenase beta subunit